MIVKRLLSEAKQRVDEVHYTDMFPDGFEDFHKKYRNAVRKNEINKNETFVQFANYKDSTLDRTAHTDPDHSDPVGNYGYPLGYILSHPADIWYGASARRLRILRMTDKAKPLYFKEINDWDSAARVLRKMGFDDPQWLLKKAKKEQRHTGRKAPVLSLMSVIQLDMDQSGEKQTGIFSSGTVRYPMRSGVEQNRLFRRAGYNVLIDTGTGALHEREPEQAVFLDRSAFEVVEIFELRQPRERDETGLTVADPDYNVVMQRKLANKIASHLDDKLTGRERRVNFGTFFWTKKGRRIEVNFSRPQSYYDRPIGSKPHKYDQKHTNHWLHLTIHTERGTIEEKFAGSKTFDTVAYEVKKKFDQLEGVSDWEPEDNLSFDKKREIAKELGMVNGIRKENFMEPISWDEWKKMEAAGLNPLGKNKEELKRIAQSDDYKLISRAMKLDGVRRPLKPGDYQEYRDQVEMELEQKKQPTMFVKWLEEQGYILHNNDPLYIPFTWCVDLWSSALGLDEMTKRIEDQFQKYGVKQSADSLIYGFVSYVIKQIKDQKQPLTFREYLRQVGALSGVIPAHD